jgi:hypothetical protein
LLIAPTTTGGGFSQNINYNSAGEIFEVNLRVGNTSSTTKTLNLIVRDTDWNPQYNCVFTFPAYAPMQNYRMRFDTSDSFIPMVLQGALSGDSTLGLLIDDITMARTVGISVPATECTVSPPANTDLIYDGVFNQPLTNNWAAFNATMYTVNIGGANGNIMLIGRNANTPNGGFYQYNPYSAPANGVFQFNFQMGNQSNQARVINMLVRNPDWTDNHSCFITVPANTPLSNYTILAKTIKAWSNIVIQGWIQVGDYVSGAPPFRFDNLSVQYLPGSSFSGSTQCPSGTTSTQTPTPTATGGICTGGMPQRGGESPLTLSGTGTPCPPPNDVDCSDGTVDLISLSQYQSFTSASTNELLDLDLLVSNGLVVLTAPIINAYPFGGSRSAFPWGSDL